MFKKGAFVAIFILLLLIPVNVAAQDAACFSLSQGKADSSGAFQAVLSSNISVSAFIVDLDFDEDAVTFTSASATDDSALLSINLKGGGKATVVFLSESGVCGELLSFSFKSSGKNSAVTLNFREVIDPNCLRISANASLTAYVTAPASVDDTRADSGFDSQVTLQSESTYASSASAENFSHTSTSTAAKTVLSLDVPPHSNEENLSFWFCFAGVVLIFGAITATAFALGRTSDKNSN